MGFFLLGLFGGIGYAYNQARFRQQTRDVNVMELDKTHFNSHGGLANPPLSLCDEMAGYDETGSTRLLTPGEMKKKEQE